MHLHDILRTQLAIAQQHKKRPLFIVETGTIRNADPVYAQDDGWSTVCFADWVYEHDGIVLSIDLDVKVAREVMFAHTKKQRDADDAAGRAAKGCVLLREGTSERWLYEMVRDNRDRVDVAFLDSDNDPDLILREFQLVRQMMPAGATLMVDDVDLSPGAEAKKGLAIVPWLEENGWDYTIAGRRGRGIATGVLIARIP